MAKPVDKARQIRYGKFFAKGTTLESRRFFFNTTAAEAILKAAK